MIDDFDQLAILILRNAGKNEAISVYEEETGCSRAEAVAAVKKLSRRAGIIGRKGLPKRIGMVVSAILALGTTVLLATLL